MSDLRAEFLGILQKWGHDIYLQRRADGNYSEDEPRYNNKVEQHTVRRMLPSSTLLTGVAQEQLEGLVNTAEMVYYFRHTANPREGDRIYENIEMYPNHIEIWDVDYSVPMRFQGGRIEYWVVGATRSNKGYHT